MGAYSSNPKAEHLLRLSSEVSRIAGTLARLSGEGAPHRSASRTAQLPEIAPDRVRAIILSRQKRNRFFSEDLFADPAWDMLLELFLAELVFRRIAVSDICVTAGVPATTGLRWLNTLVERQLVVRRPDPLDARRVFVELSPDASLALRRYVAEIGTTPTA